MLRRPSLRARALPAHAGQSDSIMSEIERQTAAQLIEEARQARVEGRALQARARSLRETAYALIREARVRCRGPQPD